MLDGQSPCGYDTQQFRPERHRRPNLHSLPILPSLTSVRAIDCVGEGNTHDLPLISHLPNSYFMTCYILYVLIRPIPSYFGASLICNIPRRLFTSYILYITMLFHIDLLLSLVFPRPSQLRVASVGFVTIRDQGRQHQPSHLGDTFQPATDP